VLASVSNRGTDCCSEVHRYQCHNQGLLEVFWWDVCQRTEWLGQASRWKLGFHQHPDLQYLYFRQLKISRQVIKHAKDFLAICARLSARPIKPSSNVWLASNHNVVYIFWIPPLRQIMIDTILIINVEEAALGSSKEPREVLNCISLGRRINDTEHLL